MFLHCITRWNSSSMVLHSSQRHSLTVASEFVCLPAIWNSLGSSHCGQAKRGLIEARSLLCHTIQYWEVVNIILDNWLCRGFVCLIIYKRWPWLMLAYKHHQVAGSSCNCFVCGTSVCRTMVSLFFCWSAVSVRVGINSDGLSFGWFCS